MTDVKEIRARIEKAEAAGPIEPKLISPIYVSIQEAKALLDRLEAAERERDTAVVRWRDLKRGTNKKIAELVAERDALAAHATRQHKFIQSAERHLPASYQRVAVGILGAEPETSLAGVKVKAFKAGAAWESTQPREALYDDDLDEAATAYAER